MGKKRGEPQALDRLSPFTDDEPRAVRVVIETPRHSRNKYSYDEDACVFHLKKVLPEGMAFPVDFGFVPRTRAGDGDPLDVAVLMDEPAFPGCVLQVRLVGIIEGRQHDGKRWVENDRLIGVAAASPTHADVDDVSDLNRALVDQLERFFENYHQQQGHRFEVRGRRGAKAAVKALRKALVE